LAPLDVQLSFNEKELMLQNKEFIFADLKMETIEIVEKEAECSDSGDTKQ